ncbi:MAG TPA: methionine adenosyltransferase [Dehalococcoidia bacterium]|nr:methionine adenosyltransferase [Dehalococcoidia bacterium]
MSTSFQTNQKSLYTSECVTEGHPDKVCDQISDGVVDWCLTQNPEGRVACEAAIKSDDARDWVAVFGECTPLPPEQEVVKIVRDTLRHIGYTDRSYGTCCDTAEVDVILSGQSGDIAQGVNRALEAREGTTHDELETGAGDQGMMFGFACDETPEFMPTTIALAHRLTRRLAEARKSGILPWLRPDGKSQVTVEYRLGEPVRVDTVVISTQHAPEVEQDEIARAVAEYVIRAVIEPNLLDEKTRFLVNPTGRFVIGGPYGDSGLTGRKIIVDTYGGMARHGGGAFSGKDPTKVDRSAAYAARWVAKNVVAAGLARRCEVQLAYAIGVAKPISIGVETFGTSNIEHERIEKAIEDSFDLRPAAIIRELDLRRPIFQQTAAYGHFGRTDIDLTWERVDRAVLLRANAGLKGAPSPAGERAGV